jgi:hypothetical protein
VSGPKYAALVAQSATAEGDNKPNMTDPTLATATLAAFAVVEDVSDQAIRFGVGAQAFTERLASESVFSTAPVCAGGAPQGRNRSRPTCDGHRAGAWKADGRHHQSSALLMNRDLCRGVRTLRSSAAGRLIHFGEPFDIPSFIAV